MLLRRVIGERSGKRFVTPHVSENVLCRIDDPHSKWIYKNTNHHDHNLTTIVHQHPHIVPLTKKNRGILPRRNK